MAGNFIQGAMNNALSIQTNPAGHMANSQRAFASGGDLALKLTALIDQEEVQRQNQMNALNDQILQGEKQLETNRSNLVDEAFQEKRLGVLDANADASRGLVAERLTLDKTKFEADKKAKNLQAYKTVYDMQKDQLSSTPRFLEDGTPNPNYATEALKLNAMGQRITGGLQQDYDLKLNLPEGQQNINTQGQASNNQVPSSLQVGQPQSTGNIMDPNVQGTSTDQDILRNDPDNNFDFLTGNRSGTQIDVTPKTNNEIREDLVGGKQLYSVSKDGNTRTKLKPTGKQQTDVDIAKNLFKIDPNQYVNWNDANEVVRHYAENDPKQLFNQSEPLTTEIKKRAVKGFTRKALDSEEGFLELADAIAQGRLTTQDVHEAITNSPSLNNTKDLLNRLGGAVDQRKLVLNSQGSKGAILPEELSLEIDEAVANKPTGVTGMYGPTGGEIAKEALANEGVVEGAISYIGEILGMGTQDINPEVFKSIAARNRQQFGKDFTVDGINNMKDIVTGESYGVTTIDNELILESFDKLGIKIDKNDLMRLAEYGDYMEAKSRDHGVTNPMYRESKWNRTVKAYEKKYPDAKEKGVSQIMSDSVKGTMKDVKDKIASKEVLTPAMRNVASYLTLMELQAEKEAGNIQPTGSEKLQSGISSLSTKVADFIFN